MGINAATHAGTANQGKQQKAKKMPNLSEKMKIFESNKQLTGTNNFMHPPRLTLRLQSSISQKVSMDFEQKLLNSQWHITHSVKEKLKSRVSQIRKW